MQEVPNWPADDDASFPAAELDIDLGDGPAAYPLQNAQVRRELRTYLPEQVRAASGLAAATGEAALAPVEDEQAPPARRWVAPAVRPGHWSPFRVFARRHAGAGIEMRTGLRTQDGDALATVLVGRVVTENGTTRGPELDLDLVDDSYKLRTPYTLQAIVADAGVAESGDLVFSPGLSPLWVIADVLAAAGYPTVPPIEDDAVFAASLLGSAHPELAGDISLGASYPFGPSEFPYEASNFPRTGEAEFAESQFAPLAASSLWARWGLTRRLPFTSYGPDAPTIGIQFTVDWEVDLANTNEMLLRARSSPTGWGFGNVGSLAVAGNAATREIRASSDTTSFAAMTVGRVCQAGRVRVTAAYEITGLSEITATITICDEAGCTSGTETISFVNEGPPGPFDELWMQLQGIFVGAVQVLDRPPDPSGPVPGFEPETDLEDSLNDPAATPALAAGETGWDVINDIAAAELGAFWFSETGVPTFRNRESLAGVGATATALDLPRRFDEIAWQASVQDVYGEVEVPFTVRGVDVSGLEVWSTPEQVRLLGNGNRVFEVDLDVPSIGVSVAFSANSQEDGGGSDLSGNIQVQNLEQLSETRARFVLANTEGPTAYFVDGSGRPDLHVVAHAAIVESDNRDATAEANDESTDVLRVNPSDWMQTASAAEGLAQWLATQVSEPLPTIPIADGRPDARRQLADVVQLVDPVNTALDHRGVVVGYQTTVVAGRASQSLSVRLLLPTWADFDHEWNPRESTRVQFRSSEAAATPGTADSLTVAAPAGTSEGDLLVAVVAADTVTDITAAGWTRLHQRALDAVQNDVTGAIFHRFATAGEPASYTFDVAGTSRMVASVQAFSDPDPELTPEVATTTLLWPEGDISVLAAVWPILHGDLFMQHVTTGRVSGLTGSVAFPDGVLYPTVGTPLLGQILVTMEESRRSKIVTLAARPQAEVGYVNMTGEDGSVNFAVLPNSVYRSWEDFNAHWAGRTWDDFDDDPTSVPG